MKYLPRAYQIFATNELVKKPFVGLFLDMGLGKTAATLTAILSLKFFRFAVNKVLVIAPLKVAEVTWSDEVDKWDHLKYIRYAKVLGSERKRIEALSNDADLYIINRENIPWLVTFYGHNWPFDMVVVDESSSFKNHRAKRTKSLMSVRPKIKRLVILTGTPSPNGIEDLWSQIYLLDMGARLGKNITSYRTRYFDRIPTFWGAEFRPKSDAREVILKKISDICISMKSEDYLELPPLIENDIKIHLSEKSAKNYRKFEKEQLLSVDGESIDAANAAALTGKLLQLSGGAIYDENGIWHEVHEDKINAFLDLIEALQGEPVLVFYSFVHEKERIEKSLQREKIMFRCLSGEQDIRAWNRGDIPVLLAHPASTAHGLNLQAGGHHIIWFGLTWNYELYVQANKRLHRSGQEKPVIVHRIICSGTRDEDVIKALGHKDESQRYILESLKARIRSYGGSTND